MNFSLARYILVLFVVALAAATARVGFAQGNPPVDSLHRQWLAGTQNGSASTPTTPPVTPDLVTSSWMGAAPYPRSIARYAAAQNGNSLYVISGFSNGFAVNDVRRYDATTNNWTSLASIPVATETPVAVYYKDKIYAADGYSSASQNMLRIYDVNTDTWTAASVRPGVSASYGAAIAAYNDKIYFVGGLNSNGNTVVSIYDIATGIWSTGPTPPSPFYFGGYKQIGQFLYLAGGFTSAPSSNSTTTMRYDLPNGSWSYGPTFTMQRGDFALAASGTKLFAIGGDVNGGDYFNGSDEVDELETSGWPNGAWQVSPDPLRVPRQANQAGFFTTAITGGEIWSTGGFTPDHTYLNDHIFRAAPAQPSLIPPVVLSAVSRKTHGAAGTIDLPLPLTGTPAIECRSGGPTNDYELLVNFGSAVSLTGSPVAKVTQGFAAIGSNGVVGNVTVSGSTVIIPLTNVANAQTVMVTLAGVSSGGASSDVAVPIRFLLGDANGDASVNSADVAQLRNNSGQAISTSTFRYDLNADGAINSADVAIARVASGSNVRPASPLSAVSRKTHGFAGVIDIPLPLSGASGIECRSGGLTNDYSIVVQFPVAINVVGSPQATITGTGAIGTSGTSNGGAVSVGGSTVTIPLTNVVSGQAITVTLNSVTDGNGIGSVAIPMRVLVGDTNGDRLVNSADVTQIRSNSGQTITTANVRSDLNADGLINSADVSIARANAGNAVP